MPSCSNSSDVPPTCDHSNGGTVLSDLAGSLVGRHTDPSLLRENQTPTASILIRSQSPSPAGDQLAQHTAVHVALAQLARHARQLCRPLHPLRHRTVTREAGAAIVLAATGQNRVYMSSVLTSVSDREAPKRKQGLRATRVKRDAKCAKGERRTSKS